MFTKKKTDEVFGISVNYRLISYVDRGSLDSEITTYLSRDTHIALRGESKCGKSWLRQKCIPDAVIVQCRLGKTVTETYIDALSQLDINLELEKNHSASVKGKVSVQTEIRTLLAALKLTSNLEASEESTGKSQVVGHDVNDLRFIADVIKASKRRLVIEDFHYMSVKERRKFAFDLKALWDYGLFVIIIGVWSQSNMLLSLNPDLSGRVHELSISWNPADLSEVLNKGGKSLEIKFCDEIINKLIKHCYGNVGILQKLTLETLDKASIKQEQKAELEFCDSEALDTAALFYADQINSLYQEFARRVASGIRTRKSSTGIYAHAMAVIVDSPDDKLINGLSADEIFDLSHKRQPRIQKGNLKTILEKIDGLQLDENGTGIVLTYNEATREVTIVDKQLLLYRKFCTVRWPWEELITEVDGQHIGEPESAPDGYSADAQPLVSYGQQVLF